MLLATVLLILSLGLQSRGVLTGRRFWLILTLMSLSMFFIGFLRGDSVPILAELRLDQWLDLALGLTGLILVIRTRPLNRKKEYHSDQMRISEVQ
jgi:prolipoprotein diacylglyceryltransferase